MTLLIIVFFAALGLPMIVDRFENRPLELEDYDQAVLAEHMADGRIVLVTFHADWDSITTDQLHRMTSNVARSARRNDMATMSADWTTKSAAVTTLMTKLGLRTVPALAVFTPDNANPIVLPDLTRESDLLAIIERIHRRKSDRTTRSTEVLENGSTRGDTSARTR